MTGNKNISPDEKKNLKHADIDKFSGDRLASDSSEKGDFLIKDRRNKDKQGKKSADKKRKIPLALDIIVASVIIVLVFGLLIGVYYAFRRYADSYKDVSIQYTVFISGEDASAISDPAALNGKELYLDTEDNTYYFGKITSVTSQSGADGETQVCATVSVSTKYRNDRGYSVNDNRIAVGSEYLLRTDEGSFDVAIVEIRRGGGN